METEKESAKEKLLEACGVSKPRSPARQAPDRESKNSFEALVDKANSASAWVQQAQDQTDRMYWRLNQYIEKELPGHLVKAFEEVAKTQVSETMRPLNESVQDAAFRIDACSKDLDKIPWEARIIWVALLVGMGTVLVGGCMVRCSFFSDKIEDAKQQELLGRQVTKRWQTASQKDRDKFLRWLQGESLVGQERPRK